MASPDHVLLPPAVAPPLPSFEELEREQARWLIRQALAEDLPRGDVTTEALFVPGGAGGAGGPGGAQACLEAVFVARAAGVVCGLPVARMLFEGAAPGVRLSGSLRDGETVSPGTALLLASGPAAEILKLERTALNFLQRLSGVATLTRRFVDAISGTGARLLDTRKTTPGWRHLEKYAVRAGGGENHRRSLSDAVLLKDNHIGVLRAVGRGGFGDWVAALRRAAPGTFLEVEVESRADFLEALEAAPDSILLDNFPTPEIRRAVETRNARGVSAPLLEASGGMRLERVREVALAGVDRISVGALTHSASALDIGLDLIRAYAEGKP